MGEPLQSRSRWRTRRSAVAARPATCRVMLGCKTLFVLHRSSDCASTALISMTGVASIASIDATLDLQDRNLMNSHTVGPIRRSRRERARHRCFESPAWTYLKHVASCCGDHDALRLLAWGVLCTGFDDCCAANCFALMTA
jgi:hypothetical protein